MGVLLNINIGYNADIYSLINFLVLISFPLLYKMSDAIFSRVGWVKSLEREGA